MNRWVNFLVLGFIALFLVSGPFSAEAARKKPAFPKQVDQPPPPQPPAVQTPVEPKIIFRTTYRAIIEAGEYEGLRGRVPPGAKLVKSEDGHSGYLVKEVAVESPEHLIRLMGATSEDSLTDGQKGLLAAYRFSSSTTVGEYTPYFPYPSATFTIELNDTTGFEDEARFPAVNRDFWPRNAHQVWTLGGKPVAAEFTIVMSPIATRGFGADTAPQMQSIMVHELAHSLDLTTAEDNAYGKDGYHYFNERITERAAFQEGFADYGQFVLAPDIVDRYRQTLKEIQIEGESGYTNLSASDSALPALHLLRVEGIVALTMYQISQTVPDGRKKILEAFKASNSQNNTFTLFLRTLVRRNPEIIASVAAALDSETGGRLSGAELIGILGPSPLLEEYLSKRTEPLGSNSPQASSTVDIPTVTQNGVTKTTRPILQPVRLSPRQRSPFSDED